jgi:hypothetical protein
VLTLRAMPCVLRQGKKAGALGSMPWQAERRCVAACRQAVACAAAQQSARQPAGGALRPSRPRPPPCAGRCRAPGGSGPPDAVADAHAHCTELTLAHPDARQAGHPAASLHAVRARHPHHHILQPLHVRPAGAGAGESSGAEGRLALAGGPGQGRAAQSSGGAAGPAAAAAPEAASGRPPTWPLAGLTAGRRWGRPPADQGHGTWSRRLWGFAARRSPWQPAPAAAGWPRCRAAGGRSWSRS